MLILYSAALLNALISSRSSVEAFCRFLIIVNEDKHVLCNGDTFASSFLVCVPLSPRFYLTAPTRASSAVLDKSGEQDTCPSCCVLRDSHHQVSVA